MTALPPGAPRGTLAEPRFSDLLRRLAGEGARAERVTVGEIVDAFGRRGHGALLVLLGAVNLLPLPGISTISGLPLVLLTAQILTGRPVPWLPEWLRARSVAGADFVRMTLAIAPRLEQVERVVRPRLAGLTRGGARRALGALGLVLALVLLLPLPLANALPGLALAFMGLAFLERDGVVALAALVTGLVGLAVMLTASVAVAGAVVLFARTLLG